MCGLVSALRDHNSHNSANNSVKLKCAMEEDVQGERGGTEAPPAEMRRERELKEVAVAVAAGSTAADDREDDAEGSGEE